ncbi:hypothetical protein PFISCL1PPCAC_13485, partial [Pristionchus fissidentatus]
LNCKFILYAWTTAFLIGWTAHALNIVCDFYATYLPRWNTDPPLRIIVLSIHGFSHVMSSTQKFLFAIDGGLACSDPQRYHDGNFAVRNLLVGEAFSVKV